MHFRYEKERPGRHIIYVRTDTYLFDKMDKWIFENIKRHITSQRYKNGVYIFKFITKVDAMAFKLRWI